jgi:hypothetical protein
MANKKINQLVSKTSILSTDLFGIGDATTGQLYKKTIAELQAAIGGAVISVNGLVGTVVLDTDDIQELVSPTNKWFTDARARGAISLTVTGSSGASTYNSGTGVLNVPTYTLAGLGGISATFLSGGTGISYNSGTGVISYSGTVYTDSSIRSLLSAGTGISYNSTTGAISYSGTVYTDSSIRALLSLTTTGSSGASTYNSTTGVINVPNYTLAGLGGISLTSLSGGTGITYNNTTGAISYSGTVYTDASVRALISASGAVSYNNTTGVISLTSGNLTEATSSVLTITGGTGAVLGSGTSIQVKQASSTVSGFLSSTDWSTFNGKASALSGTTNYHAKFTSSTTIGNSIIFDNGTNVGIGTTTLSASTNYTALNINGTTGSEIYLKASNVDYGYIYANSTAVVVATQTAIPLNLQTNATTRLTISSTGNVGIGTSSPAYSFEVKKTGTDSTIWGYNIAQIADGTTNATGFRVGTSTSVSGLTNLVAATNNDASQFAFWTYNGSAWGERVRLSSAGNVGIGTTNPTEPLTVHGAVIRLQGGSGVIPFALANNDNQGFYIYDYNNARVVFNAKQNGNVVIGGTTDNGYKLYVSGTIYATGNITANSDLRLKKNLELITNPTDKLMQLNGYSYQWKSDDSHQYGVIAQEVEKILPYAVSTGNDGIKGVSYNQIIPVLIEAVKEQKTKIENLEILLASK